MSLSIAVYLGVAGLACWPCVVAVARLAGLTGRDGLVSGALLAVAWPLALPLVGLSLIPRSPRRVAATDPRPRLYLIRGERGDARTREPVAAKR